MDKKEIHEMIRVNHAGEYGARLIYDGQIKALQLKNDQESVAIVEEMKKQEDVHYEYFDQAIISKKVRPTVFQPFWKLGGYAMGFLTAALDKKAAMCCTTAVEEVIDEHYHEQIERIKEAEKENPEDFELKELRQKIEKFRLEEIEHRDIGYENEAQNLSYFKPLSSLVKLATKTAIFASKRL